MSCSTQNCNDALYKLSNKLELYINENNNPTGWKEIKNAFNFKSPTDESTSEELTSLNGCKTTFYKDNGKEKFEVDISDFDPSILGIVQGGMAEYTTFDGVTTVSNQLDVLPIGSWSNVVTSDDRFYKLSLNGAVTINSITGSVTGAFVLATDYTVTTDQFGDTIITFIGVSSTNQTVTIDFDATPTEGYKAVVNTTCMSPKKFNLKMVHCASSCDANAEAKFIVEYKNVEAKMGGVTIDPESAKPGVSTIIFMGYRVSSQWYV